MVCCSNRSGRMIMPTLVRVRNNSSSSSKANQRRRDVAVHHADVHDLPRVHVAVVARPRRSRRRLRFVNVGPVQWCWSVNVKLRAA